MSTAGLLERGLGCPGSFGAPAALETLGHVSDWGICPICRLTLFLWKGMIPVHNA